MKMLFIGILSLLAAGTAAAEDSPISIGALLHLTGEFSIQGQAFREGIELATAEVNAAGGVAGRQLRALFEDTQYRPLMATTGAQKLINRDKVVATIISTATEAKSAGVLFERAHIPAIVLWDSSPELENLGDYIFGIGPWTPGSGETAAEFAIKNLHAHRAAVIRTNTEWASMVGTAFVAAFKRLGSEVVADISVDPTEADFKALLGRIKAANADVLYAPLDANLISFFKQVRQLKIDVPLLTSDIITEDMFNADAPLFEGVYQTMTGDPDYPETLAMTKAYEAQFHKPLTQPLFVAWGYDATKLIVAAIKSSGESPEAITKGLYDIKSFQGASGRLTFNAGGSAPAEIHVHQIRNRLFQRIW